MSTSAATESQLRGLSPAEVEQSRAKHGANVLTPPERDPWWKQFLEKFEDPVIRILMIAAAIAIAVGAVEGRFAEGIGIIVAILLATTLAFVNEYRANREFDILNQVNDEVPIKVIRSEGYETVPRKDIVVGDLVFVEVGEEVPADGNLIEAVSLQVNEARLTGESLPANKTVQEPVPGAQRTTYAANQLLRSTMVADGHGIMRVTAVGDTTEIGKAFGGAAEESTEETPLNKQLARLSKLIGVVGLGAASITFIALLVRGALTPGELNLSEGQWYFALSLIISVLVALVRVWLPIVFDGLEMLGSSLAPPGWLQNDTLKAWLTTAVIGIVLFAVQVGIGIAIGIVPFTPADWLPYAAVSKLLLYFMIAVTIIVVAVPEGLAMSVTLSLAYSMRKMTASNNLVRRMHACETIGAATVICSDKTGTLTLNEMHVAEPHFSMMQNGEGQLPDLIAEGVAANSTAHLSRGEGGQVKAIGNPTESALLLWLHANQVNYALTRDNFPVDYQLTFSTERKYMATLGDSAVLGKKLLHVKGAPEMLLERCTSMQTEKGAEPFGEQRNQIADQLHRAQKRGMRTLGLAYREAPAADNGTAVEDLVSNLTWLGFVAIADPVRPEVPPAIQACDEAGVGVKVVTGDNAETALEISKQIGLWQTTDPPERQITGPAFGELTEEQARERLKDLKVMSRARPTDKMRMVRLLQEQGEVVAVTGDGTNDAPALNHANVGLAMGKTGTSVAKEASDIILLDDSFRSIVNAIMWGRSLYENIQRFILFQLTINVVALGIAMLGPFFGVELPLTVTQMLWVNLIMDTFAALALATEPADPHVLKRPPRHPDAFIVTPTMRRGILGVGGIFLAILFGFLCYLKGGVLTGTLKVAAEENRYALSVFFSVFVLLQFWNLFNARCLGSYQSAFHGLFANRSFLVIAVLILVGQILLVQFGGDVFRTAPLSWEHWLLIIVLTSPVLWLGELWRWSKRRQEPAEQESPIPAPAV